MEVASGLAGGTLMTVAGQTMLAVAGQSMTDAPSVIIIGAGFSGVAMAHQLKHGLGFSDFTVYEKHDLIGGAWWETHSQTLREYNNLLWSFSFRQNYPWPHEVATESELLDYLTNTARHFDLDQHVHLGVEVIKAQWIDDKNMWCVRMRKAGVEFNRYCTVLISALGAGPEDDGKAEQPGSFHASPESASHIISLSDRYVPFARRLRRMAALIMADTKAPGSLPNPTFRHDSTEIIGARDGTSLSQYWTESGGAQAYWGSLCGGFPNLGLIIGPWSYPSRNSPVVAIESSVAYISRNLVSPILDNRATRVEVRQAVDDRWSLANRLKVPEKGGYGVWPHSATSFYLRSLLYGSRGLVYKNGQTAWWMNMFVRWTKSIPLRTWITLLMGLALLRIKSVKSRVDRARADVEKYVPYEKQAFELAEKLKDSVLK